MTRHLPRCKVLIVEDERIVAHTLRESLTELGYACSGLAASGEAALDIARRDETRPDLVLMDIRIDGEIDGIETAIRMNRELGLPAIFLTAYAEDETLKAALDAGPYGYLLKPFVGRELHAAIQVALRRRETEEELTRLSHFDSLTGLPNRALGFDRLQSAIDRARRHRTAIGVLFVDLDDFKNVNDQGGHATGDAVLKLVAERLRRTVRAVDTVARLGGDEFLVIAEGINGRRGLSTVAHKVAAGIEGEVAVNGMRFKLSASVGGCVYPCRHHTPAELIAAADAAMYAAKRNGGIALVEDDPEPPN